MQLRGELFMSSDVFVSGTAWLCFLENQSVFIADDHYLCTSNASAQLFDVGPSLLRGYGMGLILL
jgi:hypothetical protein